MSQFQKGAAALSALQSGGGEGGNLNKIDFAKFGVGTTYKVRVLGPEDLMQYYGYGIYKKVNTFVAKNPSTRNEKGFVESDHTPWDLAEKYYRDLQFAAKDAENEEEAKKYGTEANKYSGKERYAMGFVDLTSGKEIIVDLSRKQARGVYPTIKKYEKKLGKLAFELTKTNSTGDAKDTEVSLMPIIDFEEDLSEKERANFAKFDGKEFNAKLFDDLLFEADEKTQIENLVAAGFDISLIGLSLGAGSDNEKSNEISGEETLPF
ncbi:hypothetical protein MOB49_11470 [Bacillus haynesii]|uniref:hypothetical protein n=1 Tax=Bacillus haynesii TaxID=1925021 RepID=UPI00227F1A80|nr:hypothetical protein [Bacillus haynesii]MCY7967712.1 hypothetical protein [Bacillus haynesii]MCY9329965.1 hypothetical protein [Bacillus haynesii]